MSIATTRAKFIRGRVMHDALFGKSPNYSERFDVIYDFIDFISWANGDLIQHPLTGQDPREYLEAFPAAGAAYVRAVERWAKHREQKRLDYQNK